MKTQAVKLADLAKAKLLAGQEVTIAAEVDENGDEVQRGTVISRGMEVPTSPVKKQLQQRAVPVEYYVEEVDQRPSSRRYYSPFSARSESARRPSSAGSQRISSRPSSASSVRPSSPHYPLESYRPSSRSSQLPSDRPPSPTVAVSARSAHAQAGVNAAAAVAVATAGSVAGAVHAAATAAATACVVEATESHRTHGAAGDGRYYSVLQHARPLTPSSRQQHRDADSACLTPVSVRFTDEQTQTVGTMRQGQRQQDIQPLQAPPTPIAQLPPRPGSALSFYSRASVASELGAAAAGAAAAAAAAASGMMSGLAVGGGTLGGQQAPHQQQQQQRQRPTSATSRVSTTSSHGSSTERSHGHGGMVLPVVPSHPTLPHVRVPSRVQSFALLHSVPSIRIGSPFCLLVVASSVCPSCGDLL